MVIHKLVDDLHKDSFDFVTYIRSLYPEVGGLVGTLNLLALLECLHALAGKNNNTNASVTVLNVLSRFD